MVQSLKPVAFSLDITLSRARSWLSEKVGTTFPGGFGILTLSKGFLLIISSLISHDQKALIALR